jgi:hypothetical protein
MFDAWHWRFKQLTFVTVAILALLAARNVPPVFHHINPDSFSVRAVASHDQRPHFDLNGFQWSAPVSASLLLPPMAIASHRASSPQLFSTLQAKGFRYNRPPPSI